MILSTVLQISIWHQDRYRGFIHGIWPEDRAFRVLLSMTFHYGGPALFQGKILWLLPHLIPNHMEFSSVLWYPRAGEGW
jgi:hypothetical protein